MDENSYNEQFEELATGLKAEQVYDQLADRAEIVRLVAMHAGEVYKAARQARLPRAVAERMAMDFFTSETAPTGVYFISGGEG